MTPHIGDSMRDLSDFFAVVSVFASRATEDFTIQTLAGGERWAVVFAA